MINRESHVPMYLQLADIIEDKIVSGVYKQGDKINSVNQLVKEYGVSRVTVVQAIENLVTRGLIVSKQGKGSFVQIHKHTETLDKLRSFQEITEIEDDSVVQNIIEFKFIKTPNELKSVFPNEHQILEINRIHSQANLPLAYVKIYIPYEIGIKITQSEVQQTSLYKVLEQHGIIVSNAIQKIEAHPANKTVAEHLKVIKNSPILYVERTSFDSNKAALMYSQFFYRHDSYSFVANLYR